MKTYAIPLDQVKTLADTAAQLDHIKNYLPAGCAALLESKVLVEQAHAALESMLGADAHLVYSPEPLEEA